MSQLTLRPKDKSRWDLVALGEHQCYARLSASGERLPVFSVRLDPPPPSAPLLRDQLAAAEQSDEVASDG